MVWKCKIFQPNLIEVGQKWSKRMKKIFYFQDGIKIRIEKNETD